MAVTYKDSEKRISAPKRSIKIDCVSVDGDYLVDEEGNIASRISDALPSGVEEFTMKVVIELPDGG